MNEEAKGSLETTNFIIFFIVHEENSHMGAPRGIRKIRLFQWLLHDKLKELHGKRLKAALLTVFSNYWKCIKYINLISLNPAG